MENEYETIEMSMQKAPEEDFVRLFAFDVNPDTMEMKIAHMQKFNSKEDYDAMLKLLEDCVKQLRSSQKSSTTAKEEVK